MALTVALDEAIHRAPSALLFAAVLVVSWVSGFGPAILTSLLGAATLVALREPLGSWHANYRDVFWMAVFLTTVLAMASLTVWIRRLEDERARLLARERDARAQAEAANVAKDHFLAMVSHEMKTPLATILTWVQLLRRQDIPPAQLLTVADTIARNARLQAKLIDDLLDVSRAAAGKLEISLADVDVSEIVRDVASAQTLRAKSAGVGLWANNQPSVRVLGDVQRLQQVVNNLVSNAIKFTPAGGLIAVTVARASRNARIDVADSGQGIDPAHREHVFDRFWQGHSPVDRREGLGLGLAIVKHIVEEHGGHVYAQSAGCGHGATFVVEIPLVETTPPHNQQPGGPVVSPS